MPNRFARRMIANFKPDIKTGKQLIRKRLYKYFIIVGVISFILMIATVAITFALSREIGSLFGLAACIVQILNMVVFAAFLDFGAASSLKKQQKNVKRNDKNNMTELQFHTFFYVMRMSGVYRIMLNSVILALLVLFTLLAFFV